MIQQTSLEAYDAIQDKLGKKQNDVLLAINRLNNATNSMIAKYLGWSINRVTPRVFELRQLEFVNEAFRDKCPITNRTAIFWRIK